MAPSTKRPDPPPGDRTALRARLTELQAKLRTALADQKSRISDIVALCRSERRSMRGSAPTDLSGEPHFSRGEAAHTPFNFRLVALSFFVAWGRHSKAPIAPRA
jgi:hypothetical protein